MEVDVQSRLGGLNSCIVAMGEDVANKGADDMKAGDAKVGIAHVHNDLSHISDDYLLDVEFPEDSPDMGSGSNSGSQILVSKNPAPNFTACNDDSLVISQLSEATDQGSVDHDNFLHHKDPELHVIPQNSYDIGIQVDDKWSNFSTSFTLHDLDKLDDVSGHITDQLYYDKDNANMFLYYDFSEGTSSPSTIKQYDEPTQAIQNLATERLCTDDALTQRSVQPSTVDGILTDHSYHDKDNANMFLYYDFPESDGTSSPSTLEQYGESTQAGQGLATEILCMDDVVAQGSTQPSSADDAPMTQKRLRRPTRRYIDESEDISSISFKTKKVPAPTSKGKVVRDKREKDKGSDTSMVNVVPEEFVVKPIQVPFGSLVGCKRSKVRPSFELGALNSDDESEDKRVINCITKSRSKEDEGLKESDRIKNARQKHNGGWRDSNCMQEIRSKEDNGQKESNGTMKVCLKEISAKKSGDRIKQVRQEIRVGGQKVSDCMRKSRPEENLSGSVATYKEDGKRKHHRLWTISEIKKLIEGVSQHGVGRWTDIKRLYFSTSDHRTSVDLKDKWRNLLKASRLQKQSKTEGGKKRNLAWRPLPNTLLNRVSDLATIYPYPRARKSKHVVVDPVSSPISIGWGTRDVTE